MIGLPPPLEAVATGCSAGDMLSPDKLAAVAAVTRESAPSDDSLFSSSRLETRPETVRFPFRRFKAALLASMAAFLSFADIASNSSCSLRLAYTSSKAPANVAPPAQKKPTDCLSAPAHSRTICSIMNLGQRAIRNTNCSAACCTFVGVDHLRWPHGVLKQNAGRHEHSRAA